MFDKTQDPIAFLELLLSQEGSPLGRMYRSLDLFEYILKALAIQQLHRYLSKISDGAVASRALRIILKGSIHRPCLGHWMGILRETSNALRGESGTVNHDLIASCEAAVTLRNKLAHGTTPGNEAADRATAMVKATCATLAGFMEGQNLKQALDAIVADTPFLLDRCHLYNGIRKRRDRRLFCDYLDYLGAGTTPAEPAPDMDQYLAPLDIGASAAIDARLLYHLKDYFDRPHWEERLQAVVRVGTVVALVAGPGLGKSALLVRVLSSAGGWIHLFSRNQHLSSDSLTIAQSLANFFCAQFPFLGAVPRTPDSADYSEWFREASEDLTGLELPAVAFDALDEASPGSMTAILTIAGPLLSLCPMAVSARTMKGLQELVAFNPRLSVIRLDPLTENEICAWIKSKAPSIVIDDAQAIRTLTEASEGNFLFLRSIPVPQSVADVVRAAAALPSTMRDVLEETTHALCRRNPLVIRLLCLAIILPDGLPEGPTRRYLGLDAQAWGELLDIVDEVFKPGEDGITLFHGKYRDYLLDALAPDIIVEARSLIANRAGSGQVFQDPRLWPFIYRYAQDHGGLVAWIAALANSRTARADRLREARAVADATSGLLGEKAVAIVQVLEALEIYIEGNFQVLMDWQILVGVSDRLRSALVVVGLQRFPTVALGCVGTLYVARRLDEALALIERLPVPNGHDNLYCARYWDYRGLIHGALGLTGKAIICFGKAADAVADISDSAWLGYALMNRGKILLSQDPIAGIEDIGQACHIRERIAFDPQSLERNRQDVVSETQALITFAMGLENLMNAHAFGPSECRSLEQASGYADRLEGVLDMLLERDPEGTRTFSIIGRIVISLVLFLEQRGHSADRWRQFLTTVFVPEIQRARLNRAVL